MRTFFSTCWAFSLAMSVGNGQVIEYDMQAGPSLLKKSVVAPVKNQAMVTLKILNINRFCYTPVIKGKRILNVTPIPKQLQTLFDLPDPAKSATDAAAGVAKTSAAGDEMKRIESSPALAHNSTLKQEIRTLITRCDTFNAKASLVSAIRFRRVELIALGKLDWRTYADFSHNLPTPLSSDTMYRHVQDALNAYRQAELQYATARSTAPADSPEQKRIDNALALFEEGYHDFNEKELYAVITDILMLQKAFAEPNYFTFMSEPVQADDCDFVEFDVSIVPNQTIAFLPASQATAFTLSVPVRGGWKPDFSLGITYSTGLGAHDEIYYSVPTSEEKSRLVKGENQNVIRPGIAAMFHVYPRTGRTWAAGFMAGVGAGFKADNVLLSQYFLGGSLITGKQQRYMFSTGISFLPVSRLKPAYQTNNEYITQRLSTDDVTEKVLKASFFFGISYNITNRVESN